MNFFGKVWRSGNSLVVTIPDSHVKYKCLKEGDIVEVRIK